MKDIEQQIKIERPNKDTIIIKLSENAKTEEVEKMIEALKGVSKRIYVEVEGEQIVSFKYQLYNILNRYNEKLEKQDGKLSDVDIDNLLIEVHQRGVAIENPTDRDRYTREFLSVEGIDKLGISEESIKITIEKLRVRRDKEKQKQSFDNLLTKADQLRGEGKVNEALELISSESKVIVLQDKKTGFSKFRMPLKEEELKATLQNKKESLVTGLDIGEEPLELPSGALSIIAAPTSHGKTTFLINLLLNTAKEYENKKFYFFSYEEDRESIVINVLNSHLDLDLSGNNRKSLKSYFADSTEEFIKKESLEEFKKQKDAFFKHLISSQRINIHYTDFDSNTLIEAIRYLNKEEEVGGVFIDYFQLLNLPANHKKHSRQQELKDICIDLKELAVDTGLPIVLGAQFNREVTSHLKIHSTRLGEAGDLERIANLIVGFWNNNFPPICTESEQNEITKNNLDTPDTFYLKILKQRGGRVGGSGKLFFNGNRAKLTNDTGLKF